MVIAAIEPAAVSVIKPAIIVIAIAFYISTMIVPIITTVPLTVKCYTIKPGSVIIVAQVWT